MQKAAEVMAKMQGTSSRMGGGMPGGGSQSIEDMVKEAKAYEAFGYDVYQTRSTNREVLQAIRNSTNLIIMVYSATRPSAPARNRVTSGSDTRINPQRKNWKRQLKM
jgi:hypothetical protein